MGLKRKKLPSAKKLNSVLKYDDKTGKLCWRHRPIDDCKDVSRQKAWNTRYAGKEAGTKTTEGYRYVMLRRFGAAGLAHRIIWKMQFGTDPREIDHIDGDRSNNRICNLRSISRKENCKNRRLSLNTKSVYHGVRWYAPRGKWIVGIGCKGKWHHVGYYASLSEALGARLAAEKKYGFHKNHGRAA